jgi:hypothetical protein
MPNQKVFLIHGWSVRTTQTYQSLHLKLAENGFQLQDVFLGRYVSLENDIEISDISQALHNALNEKLDGNWNQNFHLITHSTGGLIVKHWLINHYKGRYSQAKGLQNIVHLASPHFGSRLAHYGRSMLGQVMEFGESGKNILASLELGSKMSWEVNEQFFDSANWKDKGVRIFNLIGDRVKKDLFKSKIFPAAYEQGSDMVVRVPAGNLNFKRFLLDGRSNSFSLVDEVKDIPFGALYENTHSNSDYGILNNIKKNSNPQQQLNLKLILECLKVKDENTYATAKASLEMATTATRNKRQAYAQLDFRFHDQDGRPVDDYVFTLGAIVNNRRKPSKTVAHTHKNTVHPNHFTVFINLKELEPHLTYFIDINSESGSELFSYKPDPLVITAEPHVITNIINEDQTTQIDVILSRIPSENLFVFHRGDDKDLHVEWNRKGKVVKKKISSR